MTFPSLRLTILIAWVSLSIIGCGGRSIQSTGHPSPERLTKAISETAVRRILQEMGNSPHRASPQLPIGDYCYSLDESKRAPALLRQQRSSGEDSLQCSGPLETVLDLNSSIASGTQGALYGFRVSPDGSRVAATVDLTGSAVPALLVQVIGTNELSVIDDGPVYGFAWEHTGSTLYYTKGETARPSLLYGVRLSELGAPRLLFNEMDRERALFLRKTGSGKAILVSESLVANSEFLLNDLHSPSPVIPPRPLAKTTSEDQGDAWFHLEASQQWGSRITKSGSGGVHTIITPRAGEVLRAFLPLGEHFALLSRAGDQEFLSAFDREGKGVSPERPVVGVPRIIAAASSHDRLVIASDSPIAPTFYSVYGPGLRRILESSPEPSQGRKFIRQSAPRSDHHVVPVSSFVPPKDDSPGAGRCIASVYGAYGAEENFFENLLLETLYRRGWSVHLVHVRGGGFGGPQWHAAARGRNKRKAVEDLVAALTVLQANSRCAHGIYVTGQSAGGLLALASGFEAPAVVSGVFAEFPFVELAKTLGGSTDPFATREQQEWGDPLDPEDLRAMNALDPLTRPLPDNLPPILLRVGSNDQLTVPTTQLSLYNRLRSTGHTVTLLESDSASHTGEPLVSDEFRAVAMVVAWMEGAVSSS
jgi:oligopeptidase B